VFSSYPARGGNIGANQPHRRDHSKRSPQRSFGLIGGHIDSDRNSPGWLPMNLKATVRIAREIGYRPIYPRVVSEMLIAVPAHVVGALPMAKYPPERYNSNCTEAGAGRRR